MERSCTPRPPGLIVGRLAESNSARSGREPHRSGTAAQAQYDYDTVGNVTRIQDVQNGEEVFFMYDTLDRLSGSLSLF